MFEIRRSQFLRFNHARTIDTANAVKTLVASELRPLVDLIGEADFDTRFAEAWELGQTYVLRTSDEFRHWILVALVYQGYQTTSLQQIWDRLVGEPASLTARSMKLLLLYQRTRSLLQTNGIESTLQIVRLSLRSKT